MAATILAGYYGFGNAGDELILLSLIRRLRQEEPSRRIIVFSNEPDATRQQFGVEAVHRWRPWQWLMALLEADRFVLGGGGLLQESSGPWNHLYYLSLVVLAKLLGCRTEIKAIGVDPVQHFSNRFWTRWVLNHWADVVSVRDEESRRALLHCRVELPIAISQDPVFFLQPDPIASSRNNLIACALSPSTVRSAVEIAAILQQLHERTQTPMDLLVLFPKEDETLARSIASHCAAVERIRIVREPAELLAWIASYRLVIGTRFHALVVAATSHVPFIGWGPQSKVASLCQARNMPYTNTDQHWNRDHLLDQILSALPPAETYQSASKSDILAT